VADKKDKPLAEVGFERRSIRTDLASKPPPVYRGQQGAERHTGDVYMSSRPEIMIATPPYVSHASKNSSGLRKAVRRKKKVQGEEVKESAVVQIRQKRKKVTKRKVGVGVGQVPKDRKEKRADGGYAIISNLGSRRVGPVRTRREKVVSREADEEEMSRGQIMRPSKLTEGVVVQVGEVWKNIRSLFGARRGAPVLVNVGVLLVGCLIVYGVVWNLNGVGRGMVVMDDVQEGATRGYQSLLRASVALAETDFATSEANFNDAAALINEARLEMQEAMAASQNVLRYVDLTGTVRSGQELLEAGERLSEAGLHIARGVDPLMTHVGDSSFIEAIKVAHDEFMLADAALMDVEKSLRQVDSFVLPEEVRSQVDSLVRTVPKIRSAVSGFTGRSELLLAMLGAQRDRQYLVLFQNNHEIRPTGGFIGSIGLINVDRGVVEEVDVSSVYDPDGQMKEFIVPPDPLLAVTNRWYLRDSNWFVNYPTSARKAIEFFEKEGGPTVDGVIALTPEVIRELLRVTGPINVPAYGVVVSYENFWRVTQDQVSYSYDKDLNKPKQFLADLAPLLINRLFTEQEGSFVDKLGGLMKMIEEKHLLIYLNNETRQEQLAELGWSGELPRNKTGLLAVNNANIAGHKSDQFVEQEIDYRLEVMDSGQVEVVVAVRREHKGDEERSDYPYPPDEDPADKDNVVWQRVLVPKGSVLLEAKGFSDQSQVPQMVMNEELEHVVPDADLTQWQTGQQRHSSGTVIGEEAGYTFFANWLVTKPGETTVALYRYRLPQKARLPSVLDPAERFEAHVVKQPGDMRSTVRVEVEIPGDMSIIHSVPEQGITQDSEQSIVYRGSLREDLLVGLVFERKSD